MLFFRMPGCCIILTKMKAMSLACNFSKTFQFAIFQKYSKKNQNVSSDVCYEVAHQQVPPKKQVMCKVCKYIFRWRCVKCKANLHDKCFEILHGYQHMFDRETQDLKMYELVLFSIVLIHLFSRSFGSFFLVFPSRSSSIIFDIQTDLKMKHAWKPLQKHFRTMSSIQDGGFCVNS